jgi:hypothetical protein
MKDMQVLQKFEDLYPSAMKTYMSQQTVEPQLSGKLASSPEIKALLSEYSHPDATGQPTSTEATLVETG